MSNFSDDEIKALQKGGNGVRIYNSILVELVFSSWSFSSVFSNDC